MILDIYGSLDISIFNNGVEVAKSEEKEIINKLNSGDLYLNLYSKIIVNSDFKKVYTVDYEILPNTEYNFE